MSDSASFQSDVGVIYCRSDFKLEDVTDRLVEATKLLYQGERRMNERVPAHGCSIAICLTSDESLSWRSCRAINYSRGGMKLETDMDLKEGDLIWVRITPDWKATAMEPFRIGAEVRHTTPSGDAISLGVQFRLEMTQTMKRSQIETNLDRLDSFFRALGLIET
ncbi:hypothetical protein BTO32_15105 [Marinobacter lutaoensis]|uniref:PilZ domain-containing protein n=1 Tax=Marinobacter lutaoensis TaxID=135739 RepID=A0A1V2DQ51_9GAMM|nr:PilZ domain-containing protein [Marinobacter lutaoensis]ONF42536.1 hypothetical protein BTO32_15105 [Marinobacter lutaoensis]